MIKDGLFASSTVELIYANLAGFYRNACLSTQNVHALNRKLLIVTGPPIAESHNLCNQIANVAKIGMSLPIIVLSKEHGSSHNLFSTLSLPLPSLKFCHSTVVVTLIFIHLTQSQMYSMQKEELARGVSFIIPLLDLLNLFVRFCDVGHELQLDFAFALQALHVLALEFVEILQHCLLLLIVTLFVDIFAAVGVRRSVSGERGRRAGA